MQTEQTKPFGKIRNFFWPIYNHELKKLIPMLLLFFLISFIYNVLRCMKVTLVVTQAGSGAEIIPFLKFYAVLPGAVFITYICTLLFNRLKREQVFYAMLGLFLGFFTLFLLVLYPNREALELTSLSDYLQTKLPHGLAGLIAVIRHWPLSLFYVLSELWSAVVLSMLFWGFANEVTTMDEAKRFYAIFAIGANISGVFSGQSAQILAFKDYNPNFPFGTTAWEQSLSLQLGIVLLLGCAIVVLFRWVNRCIISHDALRRPDIKPDDCKPKVKISLTESFAYIAKSRYMLYITILVVAYNIVFNLSDVLWNAQIQERYPNPSDFNSYMNNIASITGTFATLSGLFLSGNVIRRYGWTVTAVITPVLWLVTSIGFFGCLFIQYSSTFTDLVFAILHTPTTALVLFMGSAQICLGRAAKYTVFDETKEIAFIPLSKESQRKGKAVIDGIASRFGKSGGSVMIQMLLLFCGSLAMTIPYIAGIFAIVIAGWIYAVRNLGRMVNQRAEGVPMDEEAILSGKSLADASLQTPTSPLMLPR
jgi:AAA family ATP:ADP antiporter